MIVQEYLENLTREEEFPTISKKLNGLVGAIKLPKDFDEKKEIRAYLESKHL